MAKGIVPQRFLDAGEEPDQTLTPIGGYENVPLVSLKEAVEPIKSLLYNANSMVQTARRNSRKPADGLTPDESGAIHLYTMQWPEPHLSLYTLLNDRLRSKNRNTLTPWFLFLKLFFTALYKLPSVKGTIWRGVRGNLYNQYGEDHFWWGISSCTETMNVMETFVGSTDDRTIFNIECIHGKSIQAHAYFKDENEILLMPGSYFKIVSKWKPAKGLYIIHLRELIPPYQTMTPPFNLSSTSNVTTSVDKLAISIPKKSISSGNTASAEPQETAIINDKPQITTHVNLQKTDSIVKINTIEETNKKEHTNTKKVNTTQMKNIQIVNTTSTAGVGLFGSLVQWFGPTSATSNKEQIKYNRHGITIAGGCGYGNQLSQLSHPQGIFMDDEKNIYITDCGNDRIIQWQWEDNKTQVIAGGNGSGNRNDQLSYPLDIIVDKQNNSLIISDRGNRRVIRWSTQNKTKQKILISDIDCWGLAMDKNGFIYVSDCVKNEVRRWKKGDKNGIIVTSGNGKENQLNHPSFIFVDEDDSLYVSDSENHRVMKWRKDEREGIVVAGGNGKGNGLAQLSNPRGVIVDPLGQLYVADSGNNRVMRWCEGSSKGSIVVGGNGSGEQSNQLNSPSGIAFDVEGNLYVSDWHISRIQKFEVVVISSGSKFFISP